MGSKKVKAPPPRDYKQEMLDAVEAQEAVQPRLLALEKQYAPLWAEVQSARAEAQTKNLMNFVEQNIPRSAELSEAYARSMQPTFSAIGTSARGAYEATLDPSTSGLLGMLGRQAQEDLARGTGLTAEETRQAQQAARAAMQARGLQGGSQGLAAEVLSNYNLGQARQARAREFASGVYGMGQQSAQQAMSMYGNSMLGQAAAMSPVGLYSLGQTGNIFQPESQYNAQLITANRQEAMQAQIANAQARSGLTSGLLGAAGMIGGGLLGNPALFAGSLGSTAAGAAATNFGGGLGFAGGLTHSQYLGIPTFGK